MKRRLAAHVGTSGWSYPHWRGRFYPPELPAEQWLAYYAARFRTVEINNSFYQLPDKRTLTLWAQAVPRQFVFSVKASRYITHMKKLKDPNRSMRTFLRRVAALGERLGPILFQLPPRWRFDAERLERFLRALSGEFRYAFEFRDRSWINDRTTELLARRGAAFCIYELNGYVSPQTITADFVYLRLHGPQGAYQGNYPTRTLTAWGRRISTWARQGRMTYCYFDNDELGYAAANAARLAQLIDARAGR